MAHIFKTNYHQTIKFDLAFQLFKLDFMKKALTLHCQPLQENCSESTVLRLQSGFAFIHPPYVIFHCSKLQVITSTTEVTGLKSSLQPNNCRSYTLKVQLNTANTKSKRMIKRYIVASKNCNVLERIIEYKNFLYKLITVCKNCNAINAIQN